MQLISEFKDKTEFDLIRIENDDTLQRYLYLLGMDVPDFPMMFVPNKHRNLQGKVVTGYRVCGEIRCDATFRNSYMAGITERLVISSYFDPTLMSDIAELSYKVRDFSEYLNDSDSIDFDESRALFEADQLEPDYQQEEAKIQELQDILDSIRGGCYNSSGALKTAQEYKDWLAEQNNKEGN